MDPGLWDNGQAFEVVMNAPSRAVSGRDATSRSRWMWASSHFYDPDSGFMA